MHLQHVLGWGKRFAASKAVWFGAPELSRKASAGAGLRPIRFVVAIREYRGADAVKLATARVWPSTAAERYDVRVLNMTRFRAQGDAPEFQRSLLV